MPESTVEAAPLTTVPAGQRTLAFAARHWLFGVVLMAAAALRAVAVLGFRPVEWFNDSYSYVSAAVTRVPEIIRPSGYAVLLMALQPLHRFALVTLVQHLLGLATGTLVYAVLRARGVRPWLAVLAAVPVLFDAYEIQLEHLVMADTLFMFLLTAAVAVLCLRNRPGWAAAALAGGLIGMAAVVRNNGWPLLLVAAACLLVRRAGWRPAAATAVAGVLPIAAYMGWYHSAHGAYAISQNDGAFLYGRAMAFADCAKMHPPASLRPLCDRTPPSRREPSADYVWRANPLRSYVSDPWSARGSKLGSQFAYLAIRRQPADYVVTTAKDVARTFTWNRALTFPDADTASQYQFSTSSALLPAWAPMANLKQFQQHGSLTTHADRPWAPLLVAYQRYMYFRGPLLALTLLAGGAFLVFGRRRGAPGLLPWCAAVALVVVPPATAGFSYRYVLAAIPCACMAAGLASVSARIRRDRPASGEPAGTGHGQALSGEPRGPGEHPAPAEGDATITDGAAQDASALDVAT